jgi:hypothetical protein
MKKRFQTILLFLVVGMVVFTCNKKKESPCYYPNDQANLIITVLDRNGNKVNNAAVNIFDSFENYETARVNKNNSSYAIDTASTKANGEANVLTNSYTDHWILVSYYDKTLQTYMSSELTTSKLAKLQACSDYYLTITVQPLGGVVSFWASTGLNIPIVVQFNNVLDTLLKSTPTAPVDASTPGAPYEAVYGVKAGTYPYQATSQDGCSWQGSVTVTDGQFLPVQLAACQRAVLAFYYNGSSTIPTAKVPITIYIDNNPTPAGTLTAPFTGSVLSSSCPSGSPGNNVLYVYLEPGVSHTYKAVSSPGANSTPCIWSGTTSVLSTTCSANPPIYLGQGCY